MSVDTEERPINVKGLALPEVVKPEIRKFDPATDVTQENWDKMMINLVSLRQSSAHRGLTRMLAAMTILSREGAISPKTHSDMVALTAGISSARAYDIGEFKNLMFDGYIISGGERDNYLSTDERSKIDRAIRQDTLRNVDELFWLWKWQFPLAFIAPDLAKDIPDLNNGDLFVSEFESKIKAGDTSGAARCALLLKLVYPIDFKKINIDQEKWDLMRNGLRDYENLGSVWTLSPKTGFAEEAMVLTMLAAERIQIGSEGYKIIMHGQSSDPIVFTPQVPQTKKY